MTLLALALGVAVAAAQDQPLPELETKKDAEKKKQEDKKPRSPIVIKPERGSVGDDVPGGGPRSAESSKGGTPGGPSGSFTGPPSKP